VTLELDGDDALAGGEGLDGRGTRLESRRRVTPATRDDDDGAAV